jgi:hypothetical protein
VRASDKNQPVIQDADPHLARHREIQEQQAIREHGFHGLTYEEMHSPVEDWRDTDPNLLAARSRLDTGYMSLDSGTLEGFRDKVEKEHEDWLRRREDAKWRVKASEKLGEPVPDDIRALAASEDHYPRYEAMRTAMVHRQLSTLGRIR